MPCSTKKRGAEMTIRTLVAIWAVASIFAMASDSATAGGTAATQQRSSAANKGTCGQQVTHKNPGMKGAAWKAEYAKCLNDVAAGKNYLAE
jgi:hypothetical protein